MFMAQNIGRRGLVFAFVVKLPKSSEKKFDHGSDLGFVKSFIILLVTFMNVLKRFPQIRNFLSTILQNHSLTREEEETKRNRIKIEESNRIQMRQKTFRFQLGFHALIFCALNTEIQYENRTN